MSQMQYEGLSTTQAQHLLQTHGPNRLPEAIPPTNWEIFLNQIKSPLVYVLIVAGIVTFLMREVGDSVIIFVAVLINTVLGFYQEKRADNALQALKQMLQSTVTVWRDGEKTELSTDQLVPGDLVVLHAGEKIPADGKVIDANRVLVMEAMLTGESVAIHKNDTDMVYMGTIVEGGQAVFEVTKTGATTQMGKIASNLTQRDELTPLQKQLATFSRQITWIVGAVVVVVFVIGLVTGMSLVDIFTTAVALAVGAIPEGLLIALTVVLAVGMQRILKKKGLVKSLVSAETLGGVTTICTDKTGTLTQGKMEVIMTKGDVTQMAKQARLANDQDNAVALATAERSLAQGGDAQALQEIYPKIDSIPFASEHKCVMSLHTDTTREDQKVLFVNGAPDFLLERSDLPGEEKEELLHKIVTYTKKGYRLVGYAYKQMPKETEQIVLEDGRTGLTRVGLLGMSDPVRGDVSASLRKTKQAGIKLIVITGDFWNTAKHILEQLDVMVDESHIRLGSDLSDMSDEQLEEFLGGEGVKLFARTQPEQKMRIVQALKHMGEVVAMMGDGVNDAPALKRADIGIVVGDATDVAKESADLILLDSSFGTIVDAVEEGRGMFDNIRKIVLYLMCDAFVMVIAIICAMLLGMPLPMNPAQILRNNLVSDGPPSLALTVDPKRRDIMAILPRRPGMSIISRRMLGLMGVASLSAAALGLGLFQYVLSETGSLELSRSVAFAMFGLTTVLYVYSVRALKNPLWKESLLNNKRLFAAVVADIILVVAPFVLPRLGGFLEVVPIGDRRRHALGGALGVLVMIEGYKVVLSRWRV